MNKSDILRIFKETKNSGGTVALAVEGGGLRGVVSASMLKIFEDLGLADQVDAVSGTSAGAINLAYFLNKDMQQGLNLYKKLASSNFIQPFQWPNAMNLNYLFEEQIPQHFPISWKKLREHKTTFLISVTNTISGQGKFITAQNTSHEQELIKALRASASAPLFTTNKEIISNDLYNDGQVQHSIPVEPLLEKEFDLIFCLLTRKKGYKKTSNFLSRTITNFALRKYSKEYKYEFSKIPEIYNKSIDKIFNNHSKKIIPLYLEEEDYIISKMCTNPGDIQKCIQSTLQRFT